MSSDEASDRKKSVEDAITRYYERQNLVPTTSVPTRKNEKPEKEVEKKVLDWCRSFAGWSMDVVEAKAVFSEGAQMYLHSQAKSGFSDLVGCTGMGLFVAIELKAPGRLSTLREKQREYLIDKINKGCFAVVVDSVELLITLWKTFVSLPSVEERKKFLLESLPKPPKSKSNNQVFNLNFDV